MHGTANLLERVDPPDFSRGKTATDICGPEIFQMSAIPNTSLQANVDCLRLDPVKIRLTFLGHVPALQIPHHLLVSLKLQACYSGSRHQRC